MSGAPEFQASPPPLRGQHNEDVYCGMLGLSARELDALRAEQVV
jgi:hypothetical protein